MERNKNVYLNYVCPHCWNTVDECICEQYPPYELVLIDRNIQEHIRILNCKGYHTVYCCEGHSIGNNTYISFANVEFDNDKIPMGFKYDKKHREISYTYSTKFTKEEFERIKEENIAVLLEWCKGLPDNKY